MNNTFYTVQNNAVATHHYNQKPYTASELKAISLGYVEEQDDRAYNGRYFIKDGKKWIHNIGALRNTLIQNYIRYIDDEELSAAEPEGFGYDVEAYYLYNCCSDNQLRNHKQWNALLSHCNVSKRFN